MIVAVKFYSQLPDSPEMIDGINPLWPAECIELAEGDPVPDGYAEMTPDEYEAYRSKYYDEVSEWNAARKAATAEPTPE